MALIISLIGIAFLTFYGVRKAILYYLHITQVRQRLGKVLAERHGLATASDVDISQLAAKAADISLGSAPKLKWYDQLLQQFRQQSLLKPENLKATFEQAGWSYQDSYTFYFGGKCVFVLITAILGYYLFFLYPGTASMNPGLRWLGFVGSTLSGWSIFDFCLQQAIKSRVKVIERGLPDALDLLVICVEAGLSFNKSFERVAKEISVFNVELAREFAITGVELELLLDRRQALANLSARVPSPIVQSFSSMLIQSLLQGTPILHALYLISNETREMRMQAAEEKAAKLPSLLVIPLAVFILPNLFIVLLGPTIANLLKIL
jgi:tight adherence protein C